MSAASQAIADNPILRPSSVRCRSLTMAGRPCHSWSLRGEDLCVRHAEFRHPTCPRGPNIAIPLLEDLESVQIFTTQIVQGLLSKAIDTRRAGKILYACQILANTMPRPARLRPSKDQETIPEPVTEVFSAPDGHLLGPVETNPGAAAKFDSCWSYDKFRYEQECDRLGRPAPKTPADMPQSGWLTPEDLDNVNTQAAQGKFDPDDGYKDKMVELRIASDHRGLLPLLHERKCPYGKESWCSGPGAWGPWRKACDRCTRERDAYIRLHPDFDPNAHPQLHPIPKPTAEPTVEPTVESSPLVDLKASAEGGWERCFAPGAPHLRVVRRCGKARPSPGAPRTHRGEPWSPDVKSVNISNSTIHATYRTPPPMGGTPSHPLLRHL